MTVLLQASYRGSKERQLLRTFEKPPCRVVFSFTEQEITMPKKGSQEDPVQYTFPWRETSNASELTEKPNYLILLKKMNIE